VKIKIDRKTKTQAVFYFDMCREEKEKWIRAKYETKQFLTPLTNKDIPIGKV
jgi:hypothetical protein